MLQTQRLQTPDRPGNRTPTLGKSAHWKAIAKGIAKRGIDVLFAGKSTLLRTLGVIDFPVPPNHMLRRTSSHTIRHYYLSGATTFWPIATSALTFGVDLDSPVKVLDFACGVGRQLLHLTRQFPNVQAYASDINPNFIGYLRRFYPKVKSSTNSFDPPLMYDNDTFDLIYSVSIFSHISEKDASLWLAELRRVAKPGSILCLTFNSYTSLALSHKRGARKDCTPEYLKEHGFWFDAIDEALWERSQALEKAQGFGGDAATRPTGEMFYSTEGARRLMEEAGFDVKAIVPGVIDRMQDLAVLRKPLV